MNPSFEEYYTCPIGTFNVEDCKYVFNPNCANTSDLNCTYSPDYFNACATINSNANVPNTGFAYQTAKEGDAFIGIVMTLSYQADGKLIGDYREFFQIKLSETLKKGNRYTFSFYANKSERAYYNITVNQLGVHFVNDSVIYGNTPLWHIMSADWVSNEYITDTAGWQLLQGEYVAKGGEQWVIVGNFYPEDGFPYKEVNDSFPFHKTVYLFIDDFSVQQTPIHIPNVFTPNKDGINDLWITGGDIVEVHILNRWGNEVFSAKEGFNGWDGTTQNGEFCPDGVYYYLLTEKLQGNKTQTHKGFITLIR
ncbi:MAG: gliding motility-associated C-terminal domain-containing protein [Crocinitomicaceae bacterium]|nr:gliding motility-associated C-terminal domain-containing protein [Crocinitomicaceae bacterium]